MEQVTPSSQLRYYKEFIVDTKDIVQPNHVVVASQFAKNVNFFLELGNVLGVVSEHDTLARKFLSFSGSPASRHVPLGFSAGRDAHLAVGTFSDHEIAMEEVGGPTL